MAEEAKFWGTLEELLLVCAVNKHGFHSWDSISMEMQRLYPNLPLLSSEHCRNKFEAIKQRFVSENLLSIVQKLRQIRVQDLRHEVAQRDASITLLEKKVKVLEEERRRRRMTVVDLVAGKSEEPETESGSVNESNSSVQQKDEMEKKMIEQDLSDVKSEAPERIVPVVGREGSNRYPNNVEVVEEKQNSDMQSSASLSRQQRNATVSGGEEGGRSGGEEADGGDEVSPAKLPCEDVKPEPLLQLIGRVRSHPHGSFFERRHRSQETTHYNNMIRQHMDIEIIHSRIKAGAYSHSIKRFFRDLLLVFNNAIVFFGKSSPQHVAACELRALVLKEMTKNASNPSSKPAFAKPKPEQEAALLSDPDKISTIMISRKRSRLANENMKEHKRREGTPKIKGGPFKLPLENGVMGKKPEGGSSLDHETPRIEGAKGEMSRTFGGNELSSHDGLETKMDLKERVCKKKRRGANFLKRMSSTPPKNVIDDDVSSGEEGKVRNMGQHASGRFERVGANGSIKSRRVGRPPKRPSGSTPSFLCGKPKKGQDKSSNVKIDDVARTRKRSRRQ